MRTQLIWLWCLLAKCLVAPAAADEVTISADRDNTLFEDASGSLSNGAGPVLFAGNNGQDLARRALVRFDVAGNVPAGARIDAVTLTLTVSNAPNATARSFTVHAALADWGEGTSSTTSGSGAPATTDDATWLHTFWSSGFWTVPGGDFISPASASQTIADIGAYSWSGPGLVMDVQAWLDQPASNFGWLVKGDEAMLNTARRFDSRENGIVSNRPALTVLYARAVGVGDHVPGGIHLEPCRPNPASGPVRIGFTLPARARARLEISDVTGRRVATPLETLLSPGRHQVVWDGRNSGGRSAPAGVYSCRLLADGRTIGVRRVVLLRRR